MNNENQNLNPNPNPNMNPVPPVNPVPEVPQPGPVPASEIPAPPSTEPVSPPTPPTPPSPAPEVMPAPPVAPQPVPQPEPIPAPPNNGNPSPVNLQPEGTVVQAPPPPQPEVTEPLMGSPLNSQTVLNPGGAMPQVGAPPMPGNDGMGGAMNPNMNPSMMGGIPTPPVMPNENPKEEKKKPNKTLLIVLVIVLIAAVGFGVWYFLSTSKSKAPKVSITPLLTNVELGEEFDLEDPEIFAKISGINVSNCSVETDLDPTTAGNYQYSVICGKNTLDNQQVTVTDTTPPVVTLRDVLVMPNANVEVEDFIENVEDASDYSAIFEEEEIDTSKEGKYKVTIIVTDDFENETRVEGNLEVSEDAPDHYLACEETNSNITYENANINISYRYGINIYGEYVSAKKIITYSFSEEEDYLAAIETIEDDTFNGDTGNIWTDEDEYTIEITIDLETADLESTYNISPFPIPEYEIEEIYTNNGDSCYID